MSSAAQQLAEWIGATHPELYQLLFERAQRARFAGFGDDGDLTDFTPDLSSDTSVDTGVDVIPDYTLTADQLPSPFADSSSGDSLDASIGADVSGSLATASDTSSGGLLSTIGSGIASAASAVGSFLTSPAAAKAAGSIATAYFQLQNNQVNAQLQTQILQAQLARAQVGASPLPISYVTNAAGQLVPVYQSALGAGLPATLSQAVASGQSQYVPGVGYTLPPSTLSDLTGSVSLTQLLPWILLIGGALILLKEL